MNKVNQTAVDWLLEKFNKTNGQLIVLDFEQAKEMEKQEIIKSYEEGHFHLELDSYNPEQYYNETYGGNK
jgi:hypothetical protein